MAFISKGTQPFTAPGNASAPLLALDLNQSRRGLILQASGSIAVQVWLVGNNLGVAPVAGAGGFLTLAVGAQPLVLNPGPADQVYIGSATPAPAPVTIAEL